MLKQLLDQIHKTETVEEEISRAKMLASTIPIYLDDLKAVISLCSYRLDAKKYTQVELTELRESLKRCKQVQIFTDEYDYI